jgi:hypothetical protein
MSMNDKLQAARAVAASWLPDALMLAGAAGVSYGAGLVYPPAGWIVGGLFALSAGYLAARGGK